MRALLSVFVLLLISVSAHAQIYHGNDAVTLSVGNEFEAHVIAAQFCARGDKYKITRVHGRYGDEIAINCLAAPPARRSASIPPSHPATTPTAELFAQFQRALATLSTAAQPEMPAGEQGLFAQFKRTLTTSSDTTQPEIPGGEQTVFAQFKRALTTLADAAQVPAGEKDAPARPEHEGRNTYAQPW